MFRTPKFWYQPPAIWIKYLLMPISALFLIVTEIRRFLYHKNFFKIYVPQMPVVVVGNLTVGGTGKTPLVIYIAELLKKHQLKVGIISRGYLGKHQGPVKVTKTSDPTLVGDEAALLAQILDCPIVVAKHKVSAVQYLEKHHSIDFILSDDGLQHYALARTIEILVIDGKRRFGNGYVLPLGPLRESKKRADTVDMVVVNDGLAQKTEYSMCYRARQLYNPVSHRVRSLKDFAGTPVHAVAGIGNPERFFEFLRHSGMTLIEHAYADHHCFKATDIQFSDTIPVLLTEKDAVKCKDFFDNSHWVVPIEAVLDEAFDKKLLVSLGVS